jgi:hypothetical protein
MMAAEEITARLRTVAPHLPEHLWAVAFAFFSGYTRIPDIADLIEVSEQEIRDRLVAIVAIMAGMDQLSPN